ncbi:MAG: hypothetical protein KGJ23_13600 [Euryarchaeota archaeon]|nr:hypothetical protein [Euryarchaeota archaeon]MDE1837632.1 hypothetical protein [Euryarchaeota archaeon]MDE1880824.1 hypothetical protein [Euryarchaeota archaeon]MDE2045937.1 hypothetical protein [Thermoplasmata archaeon]
MTTGHSLPWYWDGVPKPTALKYRHMSSSPSWGDTPAMGDLVVELIQLAFWILTLIPW